VDKAFLQYVAESLSQAGTILIAGHASAKQELATYLTENKPAIAARIASIEPLDHPSDAELLAFARKFFRAYDRMHSQYRPGMHPWPAALAPNASTAKLIRIDPDTQSGPDE
jgi:hypothetical protein